MMEYKVDAMTLQVCEEELNEILDLDEAGRAVTPRSMHDDTYLGSLGKGCRPGLFI